MFCPQCGAPNEDDGVFCGNCGAVLNPDEAPIENEGKFEEEFLVEEPSLAQSPPPPPPAPRPPARPTGPTPATSGLAIAALVLGIGGLTVLPLIGSILALIFGYMARNDIRKRPSEVTGDGLAMAGIVMGWIAVGLSVLGLIVGVGFMACGICGSIGANSY
jgi:hypothetical protein